MKIQAIAISKRKKTGDLFVENFELVQKDGKKYWGWVDFVSEEVYLSLERAEQAMNDFAGDTGIFILRGVREYMEDPADLMKYEEGDLD